MPAWKVLSGEPSASDTASLPSPPQALEGDIEEIGLWLRFGGTPGTIRIDNFEVTLRD